MSLRSITLMRRVGLFLLAILGLLLAISLVVRTNQVLFRNRAQRLAADIRSLELRHSSFAEVQPILQHWIGFEQLEGNCTPDNCSVNIVLVGGGWRLSERLVPHKMVEMVLH